MKNESLDAVRRELDEAGVEYAVASTKTHVHVRFQGKLQVLAKTASDWRSAKNARALTRKMLKDIGVEPADTPVPKEEKVQQAQPAPTPAPRNPLMVETLLAKVEQLTSIVDKQDKTIAEQQILIQSLADRVKLIENKEPVVLNPVIKRNVYTPRFGRKRA